MAKLNERIRFCIFDTELNGLSFTSELMLKGMDSFVVLEAEK